MRDADVRRTVLNSLSVAHAGDARTRIVQEMGVWSNSVRIDVAVINGELSGWEIKSDKDDLHRLPMQADIYSRVFDRVTLVSGGRHIEKAVALVPDWWTIISASMPADIVELSIERSGSQNPDQDPILVAELLWKPEALSILDKRDTARGWRGRRAKDIYRQLADVVPLETLKSDVRETLKSRKGWLGQN